MMHLRLVTWAPTKWWKAVGADDETADPRRRRIARDALARRSPPQQTSLYMEFGSPPRHRTSGGLAERTRAIEEGWA